MHRTASGALGHTNYVVIISLVFFIALAQSGHGTVESLPSRAVEAGPRRAHQEQFAMAAISIRKNQSMFLSLV